MTARNGRSAVARPVQLDNGILTISLDFELIWGALDIDDSESLRRACEIERAVVIDRLLDLFTEFGVPATWCVVGHLLLDGCKATNGVKHPEIVLPRHAWSNGSWFDHDPCSTEAQDPTFYGRSLVEKIRACQVPQEIGCHSFSHVIFGDVGCSRKTAESEVAQCIRLARQMGITMRSFVFPRDQVGHVDVLRDHGFACYRGPEPRWYNRKGWPSVVRRLCRLGEVLSATQPPVVLPRRTVSGVWDIPGSMIYFPMHGLRRYIPVALRVRRAIKGLRAAAEQNKIFHLWFHPTNFAYQTDVMFSGLLDILCYAHTLRQAGKLEIVPMGALIPQEPMGETTPALPADPYVLADQ